MQIVQRRPRPHETISQVACSFRAEDHMCEPYTYYTWRSLIGMGSYLHVFSESHDKLPAGSRLIWQATNAGPA